MRIQFKEDTIELFALAMLQLVVYAVICVVTFIVP